MIKVKDKYLHPYCRECRKCNVVKDDVIDPSNGKTVYKKGEFVISCSGIPADGYVNFEGKFLHENDLKSLGLSEEDIESIKEITRPSYWARKHVRGSDGKPWSPRIATEAFKLLPYQELMLDCTANRIALRCGRRCLPGYSPVLMADGSIKQIKDIVVGDRVVSKNRHTKAPFLRSVINTFENGTREVFRIRLTDGREIDCTSNHPVQVFCKIEDTFKTYEHSWKSIDDGLKVGDKVIVLKEYKKFGDCTSPDEAKLLGYLLTDGHLSLTQTPKFTSNTYAYIEEVQQLCMKLFGYKCTIKKRSESEAWDIHLTDGDRRTGNKVTAWLKTITLDGVKSKHKDILNHISKYDSNSLGLFLNRLWSGDGCISLWSAKEREHRGLRMVASLASCNRDFLKQIQGILYKIGVSAKIKADIKKSPNSDKICFNWSLYFSDSVSINNFFDFIGPIYGKEKNSLLALEEIKKRRYAKDNGGSFNYKKIRIKSITSLGMMPTYDIEVNRDHNFTVNGIVTHNSGKSVAMSMISLHFAATNSPLTRRRSSNGEWVSGLSTVLVTAPYEKQINEIFDIIRTFIKNSPDLSDITTRETLKPALLAFTNDSKIASQTTGSKTGQGGDAIRGQSPHLVIMDEADLMCDADLAAIIPLLGTNRDCRLICGSTVKHSRGVFWKLCNDPTYKEFFFPSQVSSEWTEQLDFEFRLNGTQSKYASEVLVDFGEIGSGVYQEKYIGLALEDYEYDNERDPNNFYTLGVDWNDEANGSTFSVIEFDPMFQTAIRKNASKISKKDWNQTAAVQEVLRLHSIYNFDSIYVDEGHGTYQIEMLKGIGIQAAQNPSSFPAHADTLFKVVHKFNFSSSIEVIDPETQQKVKVKAKPFLIENSVRFFENLKIKISKRDVELIEQLRGFVIDHVGVSGAPIYGMRESSTPDHALMAFVLSLVAITMELSDFINQKPVETFHMYADNPFLEAPSKPEKFSRIESRRLDISRPNIIINSEDFDNDDNYQVSVGKINRFRRPIAKRSKF